jgi:CubicO group peptidase (beta-lactamase class C family)
VVYRVSAAVLRPVFAAFLVLVVAFSAMAAARAAEAKAGAHDATAGRELTAVDLEAFLDGLVPLQIEQADVAGAVVAVVQDGRVVLAKGYGLADVAARTPVSPEQTLFRTGSVTKLFTWTAVMQLVEQGKLDLDADVNAYLDFEIPHTHGVPVTLRNLMTHRGGFEETLRNLGAQRRGSVDLAGYLRNNIPRQIYKPGTTPSYSNYGAALAGYIVERVSGVAFDQYVEQRIFTPLGMTQATLRTPLPKAFAPSLSRGYVLGSGEPGDFEVVNGYPAGSQSASAIAMTQFMMAFLNAGELGGQRILKPETVGMMLNTMTAYDPRQNGIALGFIEDSRNGLRILGHGGDTVYFHSMLYLVPEKKLGFFVSYNSTGRDPFPPRSALWAKFLDRYFPAPAAGAPVPASAGLTAADVAGHYLSSRRADTSLLRLLTEFSQPSVRALADGALVIDTFIAPNGQPRVFEPQGDGVFRERHGQARVVFVKGADGVIRLLPSGAGIVIFEKAPPLRDASYLVWGLVVSVGIVFLNVVLMPIAAFVRWHYAVEQAWLFHENLLRVASALACVAMLVFVGGIALVLLGTLTESPWLLDNSIDPVLRVLQQVGHGAVAGILVVALHAVVSWRSPVRGRAGKLKEVTVLLCLVWLAWFAWAMNLFDPALRA